MPTRPAYSWFECEIFGGTPHRRLAASRRRRTPCASAAQTIDWDSLHRVELTPDEREEARALWTNGAYTEYASGAAFAAIATSLAEAGAPIDLIAAAADMAVDEMRHVELVARAVSAFGGAVPLAVDYAHITPFRDERVSPPLRAVAMAMKVSTIGENLSVPALQAAHSPATPRGIRQLITCLLADERQHALLGFWVLQWAAPHLTASDRAYLADVALTTITEYAPIWRDDCGCQPPPQAGGILRRTHATLLRDAVWRRIVAPLAKYGIVIDEHVLRTIV